MLTGVGYQLKRETLHFFKRHRILSFSAFFTLSIGAASFAIALSTLWALQFPERGGLIASAYATVARDAQGGMSAPASLRVVKEIEGSLPGLAVAACAPPVDTFMETDSGHLAARVEAVSTNFFSSGVSSNLLAGSGFTPLDAVASSRTTVLSARLANELFGSPSAAIGRGFQLNGVSVRVIGVADRRFAGCLGYPSDVWIPPGLIVPVYVTFKRIVADDIREQVPVFYAVAASSTGTDEALAKHIQSSLASAHLRGARLLVSPGVSLDPPYRQLIRTWAGLVLVIAISLFLASGFSFGGLLLARAASRLAETQLKRSLGASPFRLLADLTMGPVALVLSAALLGSAIAFAAISAARSRQAALGAIISTSSGSVLVSLAGVLVIALIAAIVMAVVPAMNVLRGAGASMTSCLASRGANSGRLLQAIVGAQVVCCIFAMIVAGLVGRTALRLWNVPLGYARSGRDVIKVSIRSAISFRTDSEGGFPLASALERAMDRVSQMPLVDGAAVALAAPFENSARSMVLRDETSGDSGNDLSVAYNGVSADYFSVIGTPLVIGRGLKGRISDGDPQEAVINESLARLRWPHSNPLGRTISLENPEIGQTFRVVIVGVAADQRLSGPSGSPRSTVFLPLSGNVFATSFPMYLIVNGRAPLFATAATADAELSAGLSGLGVVSSYRIEDRLHYVMRSINARAFFAIGGAVTIAVMAFVGLYSSLLHFIATRRRELSIRMACGASPRALFRMVEVRALRIGLWALAIALVCLPVLRWAIQSGLAGAIGWSWMIVALATLGCVTSILLVAVFPATQASRIMPAEVLRDIT